MEKAVGMQQWWEHWYRRETGGRWRYQSDSAYVPGARDLTANDLWRPKPIHPDWVEFPAIVVRTKQFQWASQWWSALEDVPQATQSGGAVIAVDEWQLHKDQILGLCAPELCANVMLTTDALANVLNLPKSTVTAYVKRGYLPQPTVPNERHPLWSLPVIVRVLTIARKKRIEHEAVTLKGQRKSQTKTTILPINIDELINQFGLDEPDEFELAELDQDKDAW